MNNDINQKVESDIVDSVISPFVKFHKAQHRNVLSQAITFSSYNNNTFSGSFYPPSSSTIIDKRFLIQATVAVTTTTNDSLLLGAPRSFPLASVMQSCTISINGNSTTSTPSLLMGLLERMNNDSVFRSRYWSLTPSYPDPVNCYAKCPKTVAVTVGSSTYNEKVNWSPFQDDGYFKGDAENSRASFPRKSTTATVHTYEFCEPLIHSLCTDNEVEGLSNVREISISCVFDSSLNKLYSSPTAIAGLSINLVAAAPKLLINYIECSDPSQIPLSISVPYTQYVVKQTNADNPCPINVAKKTVFSNIILGQVPEKLYIYLREQNGTFTEIDSNGFGTISNVNLTIGNRSGLLASMSQQQLYQMSVQNGLCMSWLEWSKRIGSVVIVDIAKNLGGLQAGAIGNVSISFEVSYMNTMYADAGVLDTGANDKNFDVFCVCELAGQYNIAQDSSNLSLGLTIADMMQSEQSDPIVGSESPADNAKGFNGGSVAGWRKFKRWVKRHVGKAADVASKVASVMPMNPYATGVSALLNTGNSILNPVDAAGYRGKGLLRM